jgi:hypothetical protein
MAELDTPKPKKMMHLNFADTMVQEVTWELASGSKYIALMIWNLIFINQPYRRSEDNSRYKDRLDYYVWLAKLAEKGKITSVFFADTYGFFDTYEGKPDAQFRGGSHTGTIDP